MSILHSSARPSGASRRSRLLEALLSARRGSVAVVHYWAALSLSFRLISILVGCKPLSAALHLQFVIQYLDSHVNLVNKHNSLGSRGK